MALITTDSIILKTQRLGEADKLLTVFTVARGKLRAVAQGARRTRSRFGGSLEPFTHGRLVLFEKKPGALCRLNQADIRHPFLGIRADLERIEAAAQMTWLVAALTPDGEAHSELYTLLLHGLARVESASDLGLVRPFFALRLLDAAGFRPRVDRCLRCQGGLERGAPVFAAALGGTVCAACQRQGGARDRGAPVSHGTLAFMARAPRLPWDRLERHRLMPVMLAELNQILEMHIGQILGRAIPVAFKTQKLSSEFRRLGC